MRTNDERERFLARLQAAATRGDIPAPEYTGRWGTLMRWTPDTLADEADNTCGILRIGEELICLRAVRSLCHGQRTATCLVMFGDGTRLWVYAQDVDWFTEQCVPDPKNAA